MAFDKEKMGGTGVGISIDSTGCRYERLIWVYGYNYIYEASANFAIKKDSQRLGDINVTIQV